MKRNLLTAILILVVSASFSQATYYWVGGISATGGASGGWNTGANWNTMLDGTGTSRPTPTAGNTDILIFDGSNVGGATPTTGAVVVDVTSNEFGGLRLVNGAIVTVSRLGASGTSNLAMNGDGTALTDLQIAVGTALTFSGSLGVQLNPVASATGEINGSVSFTGGAHRFAAPANVARSLIFKSGSSFTSGTAQSGAPFGNTAGTNATTNDNVLFEAGASYTYIAGSNPFVFTAPASLVEFQLGSNFIVSSSSTISLSNRAYGNLIFNSGSQSPTGAPARVGTLQVNTGATFTISSSSSFPIYGDLIVNGTLNVTTPPTLLFAGYVPQTISGTGTMGGFNRLLIGSESYVVLARNLTLTPTAAQTSGVSGTLDLASNTITGNSLSTFTVRNAASQNLTGDITANSTTISNIAGGTPTVGQSVSGPGIQPHSVVISTTGGIVLSLPATASSTGASIVVGNTAGSIISGNMGGLDAGLQGFTAINLNSGSNYTFKAATIAPFPASVTSVSVNNLNLEAAVTTNKSVSVNGTLTLTSGNLTIRPLDSVRITSGNAISGTPFSASKYIITQVNTATGDLGVLRINNLSVATLFPIGSATNYLPATVSPVSVSDFAATAFEGITTNGMPNGTPYTAAEKLTVVDAVWNISRINGSGDATLTTSWPQSLEGSTFSGYTNVGIIRNNGTAWEAVTGSGDNTTNTATATFSSFSPFAVAGNQGTLPMNWKNVSASLINGSVKLDWTTLNESFIYGYEVERSVNGRNFENIRFVPAINRELNVYSFTDAAPEATNYYRIKSVGVAGEIKYSTIMKINTGKSLLQVYPNPVVDAINLTGLPFNATVRIISMAGVTVHQLQPSANITFVTIPVTLLAKGTYIIQVVTGDKIEAKSFQKL